MANAAPGAGASRPVGRPARIDRDAIARAVIAIGYDHATMRRVAERLGVSVPGLYYYVRGRDDLLRLAAEYSLARTPLPTDVGQHWATWLREWARYSRASMTEPEMMDLYRTGGLDTDRMVDLVGTTLDVLCRHGFSPEQALAASEATSRVALGTAVADQREQALAEAGRPWLARVHATLARRDPDEHPTLRSLTTGAGVDPDDAFEAHLTAMLVGLAVRFELPLDAEVLDPSPAPIDRPIRDDRP